MPRTRSSNDDSMKRNPAESSTELQATRQKVAIVGLSPTTRHQAPFFDEDFEIGGLNDAANHVYFPRFDRWFELHDRGLIELEWRNNHQINWLRERQKPVYMQRCHDDIPNSVEYPNRPACECGIGVAPGPPQDDGGGRDGL